MRELVIVQKRKLIPFFFTFNPQLNALLPLDAAGR